MRLSVSILLLAFATALSAAEPDSIDNAKRLFQQRRLPEARALIEKLVAAEPGNAELHYWRGLVAISQSQPDTAISALEKATALDAKTPAYFHQLGDAYGLAAQKASMFSKLGFAKKCIAAYDRAVSLAPDNVEYRKSRYEFYRAAPSMAGGGMDKAVAEIAEIEKRDPVQGAGLRADLKLKENKPDEAFAILDGLREKFPDSKVLRFQLGRLVAMTGHRLDEGETALKDYLAHAPRPGEPPLWAAHWRLAQIYERKSAHADARRHYEETLKLNPSFARARDALQKLPAPGS